jgi:hypothetical protein
MLQRQQGDARVEPDQLGGSSDVGLSDGGLQEVRTGKFDVLVGDDEVLRNRDHVVAQRFGSFDHASLVSASDAGFPGLGERLDARHMRQGEGEFHFGEPFSVPDVYMD